MASGKTLQSTIEISGVLSPSLQAAINNAVGKLADMAEETLETADAASRLVAEMDSQEDILKTLQKAYAGYVASEEEGSKEAQDLANRIRVVSGELNENKQKLRAAEQAADALGDSMEEASESAEESSEGYTILKDVLADLATEAIGAAIEGFKELATEGDAALGMLEAKTDAALTGKMEEYKDVMYEVYNANYGESLGDVSDRLATVIQMTDDLDNASLANVTKSAIALEDVFGFDTTESLRAVNSLMDQFGITSEQAFNLIVQGAQSGLNQNDDLLDTINEYSVQFKGAGYTADDMFNMLANGAETGTWSVDKLGDAVKEFNIRMSDGTANEFLEQLGVDVDTVVAQFNKGGPEAQTAIGTIMKAIQECDDATMQYQTGVGLFGTMWEDLGADTVASLMSVEGSIDSESAAMERLDEAAYNTLEGSLSQLGRTIKAEVVQPLAEKLTPALKNAVNFVTTKVGPTVDWFLDHLPQVGIALGTVGAVIAAMNWGSIVSRVSKLGGAFSGLIGKIGAIPGPAKAVIAIIAGLAAAFTYLWKNNEDFRNNVTAIWEQLKGSFAELGGTISDIISQLAPIISQLAQTFMTAFVQIAEALIPILLQLVAAILPVIIDLINQLLPVVMQIIQAVLPVIIDLINQLLPVVIQIIQAVLPVIIDLINQLLPIIMQIIQAVLPVIIDLINQLLPVVMQIIQAVLPVIIDLIKQLLPIVMQIIQAVLPVIIDLINQLLPVVMEIIQTVLPVIIDLINQLLPVVMEIIQAVLPVIIDLIKQLLPIVMQIIQAVLPMFMQLLNSLMPILTMLIQLLQPILNLFIQLLQPILNLIISAITPLINIAMVLITTILQPIIPVIEAVANIFTGRLNSAIQTVQTVIQSLTGVFQGVIDFITNVFTGNWQGAWDSVVGIFKSVWESMKAIFKAPVNFIIDGLNTFIKGLNKLQVPDWVPGVGGKGLNIPLIPKLAAGGFTEGISIAGEAGMEAVISFDRAYREKNIGIWEKAGELLGVYDRNQNQGAGLTSKAGELLALDDFSLGSLANGTNIVIYYDFSGFTWSPQIHANGNGNDEDDLMARLKAHEAEFFDWLDEFIKMREVAQYA